MRLVVVEDDKKIYALLEYLAAHAGQVLSRTMIVEHVWDDNFDGLTNVVDVYARHLRSKADDPFHTKLIHTVRGVGYVLRLETAEVREAQPVVAERAPDISATVPGANVSVATGVKRQLVRSPALAT